jgi:anti-anti-sigma regulatory factor
MTASATKAATLASVSSTPEGDVLVLTGDIDDSVSLAQYVDQLHKDPIIDLGAVSFINSVGVREWVMLLDQLEKRGDKVRLRNVSEPMVRQMTMVLEARGAAVIESFFAPYTCSKCGDEQTLLVDVAQHRAELDALQAPRLPCGTCSSPAELDEFPARYLSFLQEGGV